MHGSPVVVEAHARVGQRKTAEKRRGEGATGSSGRRQTVRRPTNDNINNRSYSNNNNYCCYHSFPSGRRIYSDVYPAVARRVARELGVFALVSRVPRVFRVSRSFVFVSPGDPPPPAKLSSISARASSPTSPDGDSATHTAAVRMTWPSRLNRRCRFFTRKLAPRVVV